jgi:hypothetical protein
VLHHVYEEEGNGFLDLKQRLPAAEQALLKERYLEEFNRYMGNDAPANNAAGTHVASQGNASVMPAAAR